MEKVYLVDGSGYIFRAYYAVAPLTNKSGFPTGALYGFTKMLLKLLTSAENDNIIVVFDAGGKTFRHTLYPQYKANRKECPADLLKQMPYFRQISRSLGFEVLEEEGYEADDIIGTLVKKYEHNEVETVIVSADKDLLQFVDNKVMVWDTMRDKQFFSAEVKEKMGVPPEQVVELLALTGDSSDNVPGLKGVGPKTAVQLLEKYHTVQGIIENAEEIKNQKEIRGREKIAQQIIDDKEMLELSYQLVKIDTKSKVVLHNSDKTIMELSRDELLSIAKRKEINEAKLLDLIEQFDFNSLFKDFKIQKKTKTVVDINSTEYLLVTKDNYSLWLEEFKQQKEFSFDLETTSLDPHLANIVGLSFCYQNNKAYYLPVGHQVELLSSDVYQKQLDVKQVLQDLKPIFENEKIGKLGQNLKFDMGVFLCQGIFVKGIIFDTMIAAYLVNPDANRYSLDDLAADHLNYTTTPYKEITKGLEDFSYVEIEKAKDYACSDAHLAWLLRDILKPEIDRLELREVMYNIEIPLISVLTLMECEGIKLDTDFLSVMSEDLAKRLDQIQANIYELAGMEFNINSPKQVSEVLFNKMAIPTKGLKKTTSGTSTDVSVLEYLSNDYPIAQELLHYRQLFKLKSTYVDALPLQVNPKTKRLHTRFNQTIASTGRLSSSDPNLQNIPIQSEEGKKIRCAFVADKDQILISADYSQIELRVLAHLSGDKHLIELFQSDTDIHAATARDILNIGPFDTVTANDRRIGKVINFGIIYGMSGFSLGNSLGLPVSVANKYIEDYFAKYPKVRQLFDQYIKDVETKGYVSTLFGRKRFIKSLEAVGRDRGRMTRVAMNAPIQGTAADIIKMAMIKVQKKINAEKLPIKMLLQVHDELLFETPESYKDEAAAIVKECMEKAVEFLVPLKVDVGVGSNWYSIH